MMRRSVFTFAGIAAACSLSSARAVACAVSHENNVVARQYDAIIIAIIESAEDIGAPDCVDQRGCVEQPDWRPWRATARAGSAVAGRADAPNYSFERIGPFHPCAHAEPVARPAAGQEWVLYLRRPMQGAGLAVAASYPLDIAQRFDRRFQRRR
ncbi:hypothetical protein [Plastoroseomonas hellenica]|uniref:hypothetical protein n=1 Tax=Plastoroseomonas hellenica TaxID=2687306 RepID=UPI001BA92203|nr:hypothetical protein [Plastoroseomonas hellenica]MBR0644316.1 hypothetical protein [Plastoroseomonas hellenica]